MPLNSPVAIVVPNHELNLDQVLVSGQTFRWQRDRDGCWISPIGLDGDVLRVSRCDENSVNVQGLGDDPELLMRRYFHLDISLSALENSWIVTDTQLSDMMRNISGLRIVRQDPVECLFSFLCSSASPIHRIRRSVDGMCRVLGQDLGEHYGVSLTTFPTLEALASVPRAVLDEIGLGFRGKYIIGTANAILEHGGREWLNRLRYCSYDEAKSSLVSLPGVGEKVADCVCLFSLDKHQAVPIDVHMARVAKRQFAECEDLTNLSAKTYSKLSESFRSRYGSFAGWAQQYFFYGEIEKRGIWDQELGKHRPRLKVPH